MKGKFYMLFITLIVEVLVLPVLWMYPVMLLWNSVIPAILGLPAITVGQAWCLFLLCTILLRSRYASPKDN